MKMHPVFLGVWITFFLYLMVLEFVVDPLQQNMVLWLVALGYFVLFEAVGGIRRRRGDTLSETVWTFNDGKFGRAIFAGFIGVYLASRLYMVGGFEGLPHWFPRASLVTGLCAWLVVHFYTRGVKG